MIITTIILFNVDGNRDEPEVFAGVTGMDCVNQVKQYMVDACEIGYYEESEVSRTMFNTAGTFDELRLWFRKHYCAFDIKENIITISEAGRSSAVLMLQP